MSAFRNPDKHPLGLWQDVVYTCNKTKDERPNLYYPIKNPFTGKKVWPETNRVWHCGPEKTEQYIKEKRLWWGLDGEKEKPRLKLFLKEMSSGVVANTIWPRIDCGDNQEAERILREIVPEHKFLGAKPPRLLDRILEIATAPGDTILDSFAGSGTTGHAVLARNYAESTERNFILIQQKYDSKKYEHDRVNIANDIAGERLRRLIRGYSFEGKKQFVLYEKRITLSLLADVPQILSEAESMQDERAKDFDDVWAEFTDGTLRVIGESSYSSTANGIGGSFSYVKVGEPLFGEYKDWGETPPSFSDLARYVFYTETSRECDPRKFNEETGFIGSTDAAGGTSYYLLYTPNGGEDRELSLKTLAALLKKDKNRSWVIYCEKFWMHDDELRKFEREYGKRIRPMLVPFNLR